MNVTLLLFTLFVASFVFFNLGRMHKFTRVAYFLLIFGLAATALDSIKFAAALFVLCIFMLIIRVFTNRKGICSELGGTFNNLAKEDNKEDVEIATIDEEEDVIADEQKDDGIKQGEE